MLLRLGRWPWLCVYRSTSSAAPGSEAASIASSMAQLSRYDAADMENLDEGYGDDDVLPSPAALSRRGTLAVSQGSAVNSHAQHRANTVLLPLTRVRNRGAHSSMACVRCATCILLLDSHVRPLWEDMSNQPCVVLVPLVPLFSGVCLGSVGDVWFAFSFGTIKTI